MRIRKFNESREEVDLEYVRNCFADLIDTGKAKVEERSDGGTPYENIHVELKRIEVPVHSENISDNRLIRYMEGYINNAAIMEEVLLSLDRIADEYPDYEILSEVSPWKIFIQIRA